MLTLHRINQPFAANRLREEMDRVFGNFFAPTDGGFASVRGAFPSLNVWEDDQAFVAEAEIPGLKMDDLEIFVVGDELTIKGERKPCDCKDVTYHRRERGTGAFSRVLRLPAEVDAEKVEATLKDGVLTVRLAKAQAVLPRKIEVKVGK